MTTWTVTDSAGVQWFTVSRERAISRALIMLTALLAVMAQQRAAPGAVLWPALIVLVLAAFTALRPDSPRGAFFLTAYAVLWLLSVPDETTLWALFAAWHLLAFHAAVAFASSGPAGQLPDPMSVRRWLVDAGLVALATWAVWLLAAWLHESTRSSEMLVGATLLLVVGLIWFIMPRRT